MHKILLIEDDESFGYILSEYLSLHEFEIHWAKSAKEGLEKSKRMAFDLGIFDIMLPDQNGFEVASQIKAIMPELPFIFLSAKSLKIDKLKGYKIGAEDYITKPVDEELLLAKIKALIKRSNPKSSSKNQYIIGNYRFDFQIQRLKIGDETIKLTQREAELLHLLCENKNQLLSRTLALSTIWGATDEFSRKSMDVFISHLRKYLKKDPRISIVNIHGKGFILTIES